MKTYIEKEDLFGNKYIEMINEDGIISFVPLDILNSDYQAYLKWPGR